MFKRIFLAAALFAITVPACFALAQEPAVKEKLIFFFSQGCNKCHEVREEILSAIRRDHAGRVDIEERDIGDIESYKFLLSIREDLKLTDQIQIPTIFYKGKLFIGKERIARDLANAVADKSPAPSAEAAAKPLPAADLVKHFLSFTPGIIVSAGLVDGINPCAFTVIIFFISFLALQGYSRRDTALIGASFILAVFLTYLLLGLGLFGFFYSIKGVMLVRKAFNWVIAAFTLILGILAVRDIMQFRKTRSTDNMILALPASVKNRIHKVIGLGYRRRQTEGNDAAGRPVTAILLTAFVTGFLVSLLEAVCTGQLYLPTISYVLKSSGMKLQAAWYLVLYNLMFVTPLIVIFLCALAGVNSGEFSKFFHRHFVLTKSLLAIMFFVLAVFLIWRG